MTTSPAPPAEAPLDTVAAGQMPASEVLERLRASPDGLTSAAAVDRLRTFGANVLLTHRVTAVGVLARQLRNPLLFLLLAAALISGLTGDPADAVIIGGIVALSVGLGFVNEYRSERAVVALHANIRHRRVVRRDGKTGRSTSRELVPGDVVTLGIGDVVPADIRLLEATRLECDEAVLTGESMPAAKSASRRRRTGVRCGPPRARSWARSCTRDRPGRGRGDRSGDRRSARSPSGSASLQPRPRSSSGCATSRGCWSGSPASWPSRSS